MNYEYEELWQAMRDTKYANTLHEIKFKVDNSKDIDSALESILISFVSTIRADAGTLWYYDKDNSGYILPRAVCGGAKMDALKLELGNGIAGNVIKTKTGAIISDCEKDERWNKKFDEYTGYSTKSMICVPLIPDDAEEAFGAIQIINKTDSSLFDEKDLEFATGLAKEIVRLFAENEEGNLLSIMSRKKIVLKLDETINLLTVKAVEQQLMEKLRNEGYSAKDSKLITKSFLTIYKCINKL